MPTKEQYAEARLKYETTETTFQELGEELGVTHQAVSKRARQEGWKKPDKAVSEVAKQLDISKPVQGSQLGKRSPENIAKIINTFAITGNRKLSAGVVGISDQTLKNWCQEDPELLYQMDAQRKQQLAQHYAHIAGAKDWKAHKEILARDPLTKEQWGEEDHKGPTIVLNILRE